MNAPFPHSQIATMIGPRQTPSRSWDDPSRQLPDAQPRIAQPCSTSGLKIGSAAFASGDAAQEKIGLGSAGLSFNAGDREQP